MLVQAAKSNDISIKSENILLGLCNINLQVDQERIFSTVCENDRYLTLYYCVVL